MEIWFQRRMLRTQLYVIYKHRVNLNENGKRMTIELKFERVIYDLRIRNEESGLGEFVTDMIF